jgi:WD40 repeat protein
MTNWVASSGLDGTIRIWDLRRWMPKVPIYTLNAAGTASPTITSTFTAG